MSRLSTSSNAFIFDGIPAAPFDGRIGAAFGVATYYIPIPFSGAQVSSLQLTSDGAAAATATIQHTDMPHNLDGTEIDPRVVGLGNVWVADTAIGTLTIAASTGPTGTARVTFGNQPRRLSRIVLVVTVGGRIVGSSSGLAA